MTCDAPAGSFARSVLFAHDGPVHIAPDGVPRGVHYTQALIRRYLMLGNRVTFMTRMVPIRQALAEAYSPLRHESFRFAPVPNVKTVRGMLRERRRAMRTIREEVSRCDVLVARLPSTIGRWAWGEAMRQKKPVLVEFMACTWDALWYNSLKAKLLAPYFLFKNRRLMRRASHALYVTDSFLQKRYPTAGKSIGCSNVIVEGASDLTLQGRIARIASYGTGRKIVLATIAGVDVPYKNQVAVLRALKRMGSDRQRFLYRIIGPGNPAGLMAAAKRLGVADHVEFVGALRHAEIPGILDETSMFSPATPKGCLAH
jgi:glycosyltransferase involved in cell wall biosynthesis